MITVIQSKNFIKTAASNLDDDTIESVINEIAANPRVGSKVTGTGVLYRLRAGFDKKKKHELDVYYIFEKRSIPVFIVNAYRRGRKSLIDAVLMDLSSEFAE